MINRAAQHLRYRRPAEIEIRGKREMLAVITLASAADLPASGFTRRPEASVPERVSPVAAGS